MAIVATGEVAKVQWNEAVPAPHYGFEWTGDACWQLTREAADSLDLPTTDVVPALVNVGFNVTAEGEPQHVLLNLEAIRDLDITGDAAHDVMAAMALELALSSPRR